MQLSQIGVKKGENLLEVVEQEDSQTTKTRSTCTEGELLMSYFHQLLDPDIIATSPQLERVEVGLPLGNVFGSMSLC